VGLISSGDLLARLDAGDPSLRICDVRWYLGKPNGAREAYDAGHLPGAIFVSLDRDLAAPSGAGRHPLPEPSAFAARMAALGIGSEHDVVCYDDAGGTIAARLWWMLDNLGHRRVAMLDGGLPAWVEAGGQLTREEPRHAPANLELADRWSRVVDRAELRGRLGTVALLDARAGERYRGEFEPLDPVPGHIPSAVSVPTAGNLDRAGRFRAPEALRERFAPFASNPAGVVTSCGSGITACHNALAMRLAGLADPILYAGSFSDWSRAGEPVAAGPEPGPPGATPGA